MSRFLGFNWLQQETLFPASVRCTASTWLSSSFWWWGSQEAVRCRWSLKRDGCPPGCAGFGSSLPGDSGRSGWAWPNCLRPPVGWCPDSPARRSPPGCSRSWRAWPAGAKAHRRGTDGSAGRSLQQRSWRKSLLVTQSLGDTEKRQAKKYIKIYNII